VPIFALQSFGGHRRGRRDPCHQAFAFHFRAISGLLNTLCKVFFWEQPFFGKNASFSFGYKAEFLGGKQRHFLGEQCIFFRGSNVFVSFVPSRPSFFLFGKQRWFLWETTLFFGKQRFFWGGDGKVLFWKTTPFFCGRMCFFIPR
jgi:hypothetical protein